MTTAPLIPAATLRAVKEMVASGCRVEVVMADGTTLRITPPVPGDDLDMIDFGRRK